MSKQTIRQWFEDRTGAGRGLGAFLLENIPSSTGWRNTLGSLAGALFLAQIATGVLLVLYYVPHPDAAYDSLKWMESNVTGGAFVRALHYWGGSLMILVLFLHMARVFLSGAYRKPREITWLIGLTMFGLVFAISFTGQLLPYDQMGYWAAKVGVEIVSSAPIVGPWIRDLMLGGEGVGALTLTRFYGLHVVLLPLVLGALVVFHLYLLRRHGPARSPRDTGDATETFYPIQFARDMVTISVGFIALLAVALIVKGPHSPPLDLTDETYLPRPEWYFMAHFELLKLTTGGFQKVLVAFVLPAALLLGLAALPWLDRAKTARWRERIPLLSMGASVFALIVALTAFGVTTTPGEQPAPPTDIAAQDDPERALLAAGRRTYRQLECFECHRVNGLGATTGPDLSGVGLRLQEHYLRSYLRDPTAYFPDLPMPPVQVNDEEFDALVFYLMSLQDDRRP